MRRFPLLAAALMLAAPSLARAGSGLDYVVPASEGYGIADCMRPGEACGQVIADAWCEAHGHAHAVAFGTTDDITGSVKLADATQAPPPGSTLIRCGE